MSNNNNTLMLPNFFRRFWQPHLTHKPHLLQGKTNMNVSVYVCSWLLPKSYSDTITQGHLTIQWHQLLIKIVPYFNYIYDFSYEFMINIRHIAHLFDHGI